MVRNDGQSRFCNKAIRQKTPETDALLVCIRIILFQIINALKIASDFILWRGAEAKA